MKSKETEPACLACGKPLARHEPLTLTCTKVQKLRKALQAFVTIYVPHDMLEHKTYNAARRVLEETV